MPKFIKSFLATIWLIGWALIFGWASRNDFAPKDKAEGELAVEGE